MNTLLLLFLPVALLSNFSVTQKQNIDQQNHPFFVSVIEIQQNEKEKILEITCKIFTDDFEKKLRSEFNTHVDLLEEKDKEAMNRLISEYIKNHLSIAVDGRKQAMEYVGFEKNEEAVNCYFQVNNTMINKAVTINSSILFDYRPEEINILHITAKGTRKSTELVNPDSKAFFEF